MTAMRSDEGKETEGRDRLVGGLRWEGVVVVLFVGGGCVLGGK